MSTTDIQELVSFSRPHSVLEARRVSRTLSKDLVLYWSTKVEPYELIKRCTSVNYEPALINRIEIIADGQLIVSRDEDELRSSLQHRSLVRFNFADWSVLWLAPIGQESSAEIQAVVGKLPIAMSEMIKQSITGYTSDEVDSFLEQVAKAA